MPRRYIVSMLFIPIHRDAHASKDCELPSKPRPLTSKDKNQFTNYQDQYLKLDESGEGLKTEEEPRNGYFDVINFNAKIYEAIDFFKFVNISAFKIEDNKRLHVLFQDILKENEQDRIGQEELLQNLTQCLVIELIRHIIENQLFLDKLVLKSASLTDLRLTTLFKYIANNIAGDLSNPVLARVINLSRDYIGQYFKNITGDNLQKYVEIVRLQHAEKLLKHNPSIRIGDVAEQCGFADLAYFCRSFKEYWGTTARKMRTSYHRSKRVDLPIAVNG
ncbi:MAG: AraC family transcriptional regulator [Bacteroidota bacterium]